MELIENARLNPAWVENIRKGFSDMNIPEGEIEKFRNMLKGLTVYTGEHLEREGDLPQKLAFVVSGIFRAYYLTEAGDEKTIVFRGVGKPLSAYSSFLKEEPAKFSIQALENSTVLYITIKDFERLLAGDSSWKINTGQYYMNLFIDKEKRERELLSDDAETRYLKFLKEYPGLINRINHYHIASYLGISNVSLSRIRSRQG